MQTWLVTIAGETELAVLADSPASAARLVSEEIIRASRLRVRPAPPALADAVVGAKPKDRARLLQRHGNPTWYGDTRREERRVREYVDLQARIDEYTSGIVASTPRLSPGQVRQVQRLLWPSERSFPASAVKKGGVIAAARLVSDEGKRAQT